MLSKFPEDWCTCCAQIYESVCTIFFDSHTPNWQYLLSSSLVTAMHKFAKNPIYMVNFACINGKYKSYMHSQFCFYCLVDEILITCHAQTYRSQARQIKIYWGRLYPRVKTGSLEQRLYNAWQV